MNKNSLLEFGSKVDVLLRTKTNCTINGKEYSKNEPYLFLKDVDLFTTQKLNEKGANTKQNLMATSDAVPDEVVVGNIPFSRKIISLLLELKDTDKFFKTQNESITAANGELLPINHIAEEKEITVYDKNFNKIIDFEIINIGDFQSIEGDFIDNEEYLIFFSTEMSGISYDFNKCDNPYLSMEIQGKGNIDKETKDIVIYFDKVSLLTPVDFTFVQDEIINIPLRFKVIGTKNNSVAFGEVFDV